MNRQCLTVGWCTFVAAYALLAGRASAEDRRPRPPSIDFSRDVLPILSDNCFRCHGPDASTRKAKLRLDTQEGAFRTVDPIIVPGKASESELVHRITATDDEEIMPPRQSNRALSTVQIDVLRRWIDEGARWGRHWAFEPPKRPLVPKAGDPTWIRNPIDSFIVARLEREGLAPANEADRAVLIRRVTLDLTGLPPTQSEVDAFVADPSPHAYEKVVDRLLASPRFGERLASHWLDAARYADTSGYQSDGERFMWRWRDWVIKAFNRNMPFDQFTIEQLAGDLLPNPTLDQRIATGFNRNHRGNAEGGIIPEEYAAEYVVDRVDTTSTVWLGMAVGCARCHDHKYDPISQREYYGLFAYFNSVPERGRAVKYGNSPPLIPAPLPEQQAALASMESRISDAEAEFSAMTPALLEAQARWEPTVSATTVPDWSVDRALRTRLPLDAEARVLHGPTTYAEGRIGKAVEFDGRGYADAGNVGHFGFDDKFTLSAWIFPTEARGGPIVSRMKPVDQGEGYSVVLDGATIRVNLVNRWLDDALRVEAATDIQPNQWHHVAVSYDGTRFAESLKVYVNGRPVKVRALLDELNQTFKTTEPFRIGAAGADRFRGRIDEVSLFDDVLKTEEVAVLAVAESLSEIAAISPGERSPNQRSKLAAGFLAKHAPEPIRLAHERVQSLRRNRERMIGSFPTVMVMQEMNPPRPAFVLKRGQYDQPGERVERGVPSVLPPLPANAPKNRLGLARWLVDPGHPLTARVAANRFWQHGFGAGLVRTAEDFGAQGERPSHPELLDWLAVELIESGWNVKAIERLIVTSAAYRQDSRAKAESLAKDPENRLLSRGPRLRLSAEMIRDQALSASGLLAESVGGPSVRPYQPAGLWKELGDTDYVQGHGADLYRRSLYTFWKRTVPPPTLITFDATGREACSVRLSRTNTPLQALALLNDVAFVEAARVLAERAMIEGGTTPESRLTYLFRSLLARSPKSIELHRLQTGFSEHLVHFRQHPDAARALIQVGEVHRDERLDPAEHAAYSTIANMILSLDEAITKG